MSRAGGIPAVHGGEDVKAAVQEDLAGLEELLVGEVLCEFAVSEPDGSAGPCVRLAVAVVTVQCDATRHGADRLICESCLSDLVLGWMVCKGCYRYGFFVVLRFVMGRAL